MRPGRSACGGGAAPPVEVAAPSCWDGLCKAFSKVAHAGLDAPSQLPNL